MEMKINADGTMPQTTVLKQTPTLLKTRHEYSNGLILITEQTSEETVVNSNYNWILEADGSYTPKFDSPNPKFVDEK